MTASAESQRHAAMAQALHRQRRYREAVTAYRATVALAPDWTDAWLNLALCELELGEAAAALAAARRASELAPGHETAWDIRARAAIAAEAPDEAIEASQRLAALAPTRIEYVHRLAVSLRNRHRFREAREAFDEVTRLDPHYLPARWEAMQSIPFVLSTDSEADALIGDYESRLAEFEHLPLDDERLRFFLAELVQGSTNFGLHTLGRSLPELQRRYARVVQRLARAWVPTPAAPARATGQRIRVGFVSPSLHHHTVGRLFRAFPLGLPRERFETFVFDLGGADDDAIASLRAKVEHFVSEPADARAALERVGAAALDVLVFLDVGMDWRMQFLASFRLAPTQYATWGHPVTTGLDTIDGFISVEAMEPPDGERHYTEPLLRLPHLGVCYSPPLTQGSPAARDPSDTAIRYFCPQAAFKLLPMHDELFARILSAVPLAQLTLLPHPSRAVCDELAARMRPAFAAHGVEFDARVAIRPHLPEAEYFTELARTDVMLDTLGWSGGMTSIDALGLGIPVVTIAGEMMRGRQTCGALQRLGIDATIAFDPADYVGRAVSLGGGGRLRDEFGIARASAPAGTAAPRRHRADRIHGGAARASRRLTGLEDRVHRDMAGKLRRAARYNHGLRAPRPLGRAPPARKSAMQYIYTMIGVSKTVPPKREIIKDISLSFFPGAKIGLLGVNGSGKSTVLRIMAGVDTEFNGESRANPGTKIGFLEQEPKLNPAHTVREAVEEGLGDLKDAQAQLEAVYAAYAEEGADFDKLAADQARLEAIIHAGDGHNIDQQLEVAADALRLPAWDAKVAHLSGGEKRRVALCKLLLSNPDMLLLDEPTNHLDAESVEWLEQFLARYPGTVVAVTHDRYFLDNAAEWILELDRGRGIPWKGNYTSWLEQKDARLKQEQSTEKARHKAIQRELEWVRQNAKGRQSKGKARLNRFEELNSVEYQQRNETNEIYIPPGERLGNEVIEFRNVSKSFGDRLLIDELSFKVPPGAIVGIIGPNGAGKSTLFRMLIGREKPDSGEILLGKTVQLAYVDQSRDTLDPNKTVWQEVSGGSDMITVGKYQTPSRGYIGRFNFKGGDQQKLAGTLSGGERGRLHLAKTLMEGGNVLLLDEPSNDLDVETLRALEEAMLEFPGCVMVISHDRWFLDRIATHILAFEGDSHVEFFPGNYNEYEADKKRRLGDEAAKPHRIKYKPLR